MNTNILKTSFPEVDLLATFPNESDRRNRAVLCMAYVRRARKREADRWAAERARRLDCNNCPPLGDDSWGWRRRLQDMISLPVIMSE